MQLCREALDDLAALSEIMRARCRPGEAITQDTREMLMRQMKAFSNSVLTIDEAVAESKTSFDAAGVPGLKNLREELRAQVCDPLVAETAYEKAQIGQIEATILKIRRHLIKLTIGIVKPF